jgi:predicted 2-oxoglutarate/Fe(II)-dependent dioxygenase YbiX
MSKLTCMYYEKAMPVAFCNYVMNSIDWGVAQDATVFKDDGAEIKQEHRRAHIVSQDLMSPIGSVCKNYLIDGERNGQWVGTICDFDIVQIIKYTEGGHYMWHNDVLPPKDGKVRGVSLVMLLNHPNEFDGGLLQIKDKSDNLLKNKGDIVVFDSKAEHRVTPVTSGVRYTAVCWAKTFYEE